MIPLQSAFAVAFRCCQEIHQVAGCFPVFLVLEHHIEVGGRPEHVQERPQCKALGTVNFERCGRSATRPISAAKTRTGNS